MYLLLLVLHQIWMHLSCAIIKSVQLNFSIHSKREATCCRRHQANYQPVVQLIHASKGDNIINSPGVMVGVGVRVRVIVRLGTYLVSWVSGTEASPLRNDTEMFQVNRGSHKWIKSESNFETCKCKVLFSSSTSIFSPLLCEQSQGMNRKSTEALVGWLAVSRLTLIIYHVWF